MMKKQYFILVLFISMMLASVSCEAPTEQSNNKLICDVEDPLNDLPWLKDIKQSIQLSMRPTGSQIIQYTYKGEYVFWIDLCYQCPDAIISLYNCAGEVICEFGGIDGRNTCIDFDTEATDSTMLFYSIQPAAIFNEFSK